MLEIFQEFFNGLSSNISSLQLMLITLAICCQQSADDSLKIEVDHVFV